MENPELSSASVLNQWENEGKNLTNMIELCSLRSYFILYVTVPPPSSLSTPIGRFFHHHGTGKNQLT
ncbi:hypothetical protein MTR_2g025360 [Medicago truncatula]|uniref:Uncharacterized protein n=1 Tax=Medicago truncatula TaxID=3880 RepID=G7ILT0_MEDTR|nr:hypothetical protein MTR_2g025360 [Medicago truncatula]